MSDKPLDFQRLPFEGRNSSAVRPFHPSTVAFTNTDTCNSFPWCTTKILEFPSPSIALDRPIEKAAERDKRNPRLRSIPFSCLILKRVLDLVLSSIALLLLWPFLLVIALVVKLASPGPVFYASLRAGEKGKKFVCYKFRTMADGADELRNSLRPFNERQDPFFKIAEDPRITRIGRFLRKYSLDELPQFWNVLKGDMSLVGPRPHPLDDCARYRPGDHRRLDVKPGITGLWQISARTNPSFETCMALDLAYIKHWDLLLDFRILLRTLPAVLSGEAE